MSSDESTKNGNSDGISVCAQSSIASRAACALTSGNSYKYKVADNAVLPAAGQSVKGWTAWNGTDEITAATGKEICVVECDSAYRALKAGVATVTAKA